MGLKFPPLNHNHRETAGRLNNPSHPHNTTQKTHQTNHTHNHNNNHDYNYGFNTA